LGVAAIAVALAAGGLAYAWERPSVHVAWGAERHPQLTWAACNRNAHSAKPSTFHPLSDSAAAALVTPEPETRPANATAFTLDGTRHPAMNDYVPTPAQIREFLRAKTSNNQTNIQFNPYFQFVDGRDGIHDPSTDDLIQWAAHKWEIPEDWLRAEYVLESNWNGFQLGDLTPVKASWYGQYPPQSRGPKSQVYQSLGMTQIRWAPDGSLHPGTEPVRWESTSFNVDYQAATIRFYYDNPQKTRSAWGDSSYQPCEKWNSIGAWFDAYPWNSPQSAPYVASVKQNLGQAVWRSQSFLTWTAPLPPGVSLAKRGHGA
jgi:hypothetical protein